jgi:amidase
VVARSLRDTARLLDLLRPPGERRRAPELYTAALDSESPPLRIGLCTRSPADDPVHPDCIAAVEATGAMLESEGHHVEANAPKTLFESEERSLHGAVLGFHEYRACVEDLAARLGRPVTADDVEPFLWELAREGGEPASAAAVERSARWIAGWARRTRAWFDDFDLLLSPTVGEPAPPLESLDPFAHTPTELLTKMLPHMAFTEIWNATGQPAISLPLGWSEAEGLPLGVQLVAPPGREDRLLSLAARLLPSRRALPRRPSLHA